MTRRNFILLVIVLILTAIFLFWFFYLRPRPINTTPGETGGFFSSLNPFGKTKVVTPPTNNGNNTDNGENPPPTNTEETKKLTKVSSMPIAGYTPFEKEKVLGEFYGALRYVDRATGNIYQTFTDEIRERKFSNTIIPTVYEALFANDGNTVVMRYLKKDGNTIQTFVGNLPIEKLGDDSIITNDVQGTFLPDNVVDLSVSPDASKLFYLLNTGDNVSGIILNLKDSKKTQVFDSPFTEWLSSWGGEKSIILNTKASGVAPGFVYSLETNRRIPVKLVGDIAGLTALPNTTGKILLLSDSNLSLSTYNTQTRERISLGLNTLAEKCTWDSAGLIIYCAVPEGLDFGTYPDSWYQGEVSFNDKIWKIDTETNTTTEIINPATETTEKIDGIKLKLDNTEKHLFFVNKKDSFLWKLDLE